WSDDRPHVSLGLHVDLQECEYRDGGWHVVYRVVDPDDERAVESEVARQLECFDALIGRPPTHLDSHQHVHTVEPVHSVLLGVARELGVSLRGVAPGPRFEGGFYGQTAHGDARPDGITVDALVAIVHALPAGTTELGCHPGE